MYYGLLKKLRKNAPSVRWFYVHFDKELTMRNFFKSPYVALRIYRINYHAQMTDYKLFLILAQIQSMRKIGLVVGLLYEFLITHAQTEDSVFIRRIADEVLTNATAYQNLHTLTKQVGGRLSGSPQMVKAEAWGQRAMTAENPDTVWLQECQVPHWIRGGQDAATAKYGHGQTKKLDVIALGNSAGSMKPLTAPVIEIASFDDLETKKDLVKGKIVFYNYKFKPNYIHTFEAYRDAVPYRAIGPSRAAKYGAVAVVVRSMSESTNNNPHTGSLHYLDSIPKIPAVA